MYEELLPFWNARCQAVRERKGSKRNRYDMRIHTWSARLRYLGLSEDYLTVESACLVGGIMLFTWEAGVEPRKINSTEPGGCTTPPASRTPLWREV